MGLAVRNHQGQVEAAMAERITEALSADHMECLPFLKALQFARDFGITHFIMEDDALSIAQKINSNGPDLSLLGNLIHGMRSMLNDFDFYQSGSCKEGKQCSGLHLV